jgi:hypothetical protein
MVRDARRCRAPRHDHLDPEFEARGAADRRPTIRRRQDVGARARQRQQRRETSQNRLAVVAEGLLIAWMAGLKPWRAMVVSLVANAASVLAGLWIAG